MLHLFLQGRGASWASAEIDLATHRFVSFFVLCWVGLGCVASLGECCPNCIVRDSAVYEPTPRAVLGQDVCPPHGIVGADRAFTHGDMERRRAGSCAAL